VDIDVASGLSPEQAAQRVRSLVTDRVSLEVSVPARACRRLLGSVDGPIVHLVVRDDRPWTRRMSWNVEFAGEIAATPSGSAVRGTIDVPDRQMLDALIWIFRLTAMGIAILIVAIQTRTAFDPGTAAYGVVMAAFVWFITMRVRNAGVTFAAEDADLIERTLRTTLER
jgi:hypothetical protein